MSGLFNKGTNTTTTTSSPPPQVSAAYNNIMNQASGVASTPYTPYGGPLVAGFTPDQLAAFQGYRDSQGIAQPWINQAAVYGAQGAAPITPGQIGNYFNPFTQYATNATVQNFNDLNAQQNQQIVSNAIKSGAWGGDRAAIAQAELAKQQVLGEAPTLAGMNVQGYNTALSAAQQDALRAGQAAYTFGQLGSEEQNTTLAQLQALMGAGTTQQQLAQAGLNVPYQQYLEQRAYPFQTLSWLAGIDTGVGSQSGGTSSTTGPPPNMLAQLLGIGAAGTGAYLGASPKAAPAVAARGGGIHTGYRLHRDVGGSAMPFGGGFIPTVPIHYGSGPPKPPGQPGQQQSQNSMLSGLNAGSSFGKLFGGGSGAGASTGATTAGAGTADAAGSAAEGAGIATEGAAASEGAAAAGEGAAVADAGAAAAATAGGGTFLDTLASFLPFLFAAQRGGGIHLPRHLHAGGGGVGIGDAGRGFAGYDADVYNPVPGEDLPSLYDPGQDVSGTIYGGPGSTRVAGPSAVTYGNGRVVEPSGLRTAGIGVPTDIPTDIDAGRSTFDARFGVPAPTPAAGLDTALNSHVVPGGVYNTAGAPEAPSGLVTPISNTIAPALPPPVNVPPSGASDTPMVTAADYSPTPAAPPPLRAGLSAARPSTGNDTANLFGFNVPRSLSAPLMAAGFSMMASRSPFLGQAIGEGGLAGVAMYQAQQERDIKHATEQQKIQMTSDRLKALFDRQGATAAETARHHREIEEAGRWTPAGMTADGHPIVLNSKTGEMIDKTTGKPPAADAKVTLKGMAQGQQAPTLAPETIDRMAEQAERGDYSWKTGLGRSPANLSAVENRLTERLAASGKNGAQQAATIANFKGQTAAIRVASQRAANVDAAVEEARNTFPLAIEASANLPRSDWVPWNRAVQMWQAGTSSPELARYVTALRGAMTAYSQAMSRTGTNSVFAQQSAEHLLNQASGHEGIVATFQQMEKEMQAAASAPDIVRRHILERISGDTGKSVQELERENAIRNGTAPGGAPPPSGAPPSRPATVPADSQYSPSTGRWRDRSGNQYDASGAPI